MAAINLKFTAWGEEVVTEEIMVRPVVEYESFKLRDPFESYLIKDESNQVLQANMDLIKPKLDLGKLKVQGIIWGVKTPQAIINNEVLTIGDLIEGAKILSIDKKGVNLNFNGEVFDLTVPGQNSVDKEVN